jgi:hypothetical protein
MTALLKNAPAASEREKHAEDGSKEEAPGVKSR